MKKSLLWRIVSPDNPENPSYLFGTMHVRDLRAFGWLEPAKQKIAECSTFATEFDFSELDPQLMAEATRLKGPETLQELLRPGVWKNLERYAAKKLGMAPGILQFQHPMLINGALTNAMTNEEAEVPLDETLWQYARELGKTTTGVESFAAQIQILKSIPMAEHVKHLSWLVKNYGRQKRRLKKMLHWYGEGDIDRLYQLAKKDTKGMRPILLYDRNKRMTKRLAELASGQSVFCAVGAGHLAGEKGMLRLLKKRGFKVKSL